MWLKRKGRENILMKTGPLKKDMFKALLTLNSFLGSATAVKRDVLIEIGGFDERKDFVHAEDYETWLKAAYLGRKFAFINEPLGEYRVHDSNLSHDFERALLNEINVINKHFGNFKSKIPFYKTFLRSIPVSRVFLTMGVRYFSQKKYVLGIANILKSFFINPLSLLNFLFSSFNNVLLKSINKSSL
jgi:GT2 family glycosyltransferase